MGQPVTAGAVSHTLSFLREEAVRKICSPQKKMKQRPASYELTPVSSRDCRCLLSLKARPPRSSHTLRCSPVTKPSSQCAQVSRVSHTRLVNIFFFFFFFVFFFCLFTKKGGRDERAQHSQKVRGTHERKLTAAPIRARSSKQLKTFQYIHRL